MKKITTMTAYELDFYKAGILDSHDGVSVIPCKSKRYIELLKKHKSRILDPRGDNGKAYFAGVKFETDRQIKLVGII
ncbi:hypothetical protein [Caproiciproducens faecalis]|uniref:Uncharacterized protein n=1 Tax=Caproiciproducens faecalis TaxID=2820301 RepID=A0ABS7DPP0_9FIRM|nr:hypothetical protein [Caproiciproducens faecalis]MBW7573158.1 hypothetical protein [Caproiciproducens faecalis]